MVEMPWMSFEVTKQVFVWWTNGAYPMSEDVYFDIFLYALLAFSSGTLGYVLHMYKIKTSKTLGNKD